MKIKVLKNGFNEKGIYLNNQIPLSSNTLLSLVLKDSLKPSWLSDNKSNPIFFPFVYKNIIDGDPVAFFSDGRDRFPAIIRVDDKFIFNFDPLATIECLLNERYLKANKLFYQFLPVQYHLIPGRVRRQIKKFLIFLAKRKTSKKSLEFPSWPVDASVEIIRHIYFSCQKLLGDTELRLYPDWPENKKFVVLLTHDIDTAKGFRNINKFVKIEAKYNIRSSWFVVGHFFHAFKNQLSDLMHDGFEIGCHGYLHDNKLISLGQAKMEYSLRQCAEMLNRLNIKGFRSPSLLRSAELFRALEGLFLYDTSVPDTEAFLQIAPHSGCCSIFPYKIRDKLWELPITLPLDSTLLALNYRPGQIYETWKDKIDWIKKLGGMAHLVTHAETYYSGNNDMLGAYEKLVDYICQDSECWITRPQDLAVWWKDRSQM